MYIILVQFVENRGKIKGGEVFKAQCLILNKLLLDRHHEKTLNSSYWPILLKN